MPIFKRNAKKFMDLPEDDKLHKLFDKWISSEDNDSEERRKMRHEFLKDGGIFDKFAGEDNRISKDEYVKFQTFVNAMNKKMYGKWIEEN